MFLGLFFPIMANPRNLRWWIRMIRSLRLGLLNLPRKVKILELRTQRQITEASAMVQDEFRLALFGSVWLYLAPWWFLDFGFIRGVLFVVLGSFIFSRKPTPALGTPPARFFLRFSD